MSEQSKFKKGDIVLNRWAGPDNPLKHFIIHTMYGKSAAVIEYSGQAVIFDKTPSYANIYENHNDGKAAFVKVGESKIFDLMEEELTRDYKVIVD